MTFPRTPAFGGLTDDGSLEALLSKTDTKLADVSTSDLQSPPLSSRVRSLTVHALLLVLASVLFALWISTIESSCSLDPLLTYSPVNEAIQYVEKQFDASLNSTSAFRGHPSPEIDSEWARISLAVKATRLTRNQFLMVGGNDTTAAVKYRPEDGGGYMSQVDGYHHLHCLDLLRMYIRRDHYAPFDPSFNGKLRPHLGHCIEMLRQKLMCTSDLTMITYDWVPGFAHPMPNLNAIHQCVDFERILDWSEEHSAHVLASHVIKFGDATELAEEPM